MIAQHFRFLFDIFLIKSYFQVRRHKKSRFGYAQKRRKSLKKSGVKQAKGIVQKIVKIGKI